MEQTLFGRLKHAWNAFVDRDQSRNSGYYSGTAVSAYSGRSTRPDQIRPMRSIERTVIQAIYARMSIDVSSIDIRHVRVDDQGRYTNDIDSYLNECLTVEANLDQAARAFRQDQALTLFTEGYMAIVPVDATGDPDKSGSYDVISMRVGIIKDWRPQTVVVSVYDEKDGHRKELELPKKMVAIVTNPFYSVMNEPNSTLQRLNHKLALLDAVDEQSSSGKLDLIIQLPYVVKNATRQQQAEERRKAIEVQLKGSQYGIAYIDGTERITQLNRPVENNLLKQIEYLTALLYSQLGITNEIMNGTASEDAMQNYFNRTIEPIVDAICESMHRTFLTKTARTQGQAIKYFRDPFKLITVTKLAEITDKFTRNEVASSNEIRKVMGWKPSTDPRADELRNSNMPNPAPQLEAPKPNPGLSPNLQDKEE